MMTVARGRPSIGGRKKPYVVSCRVDEETYRFVKRHGGGQRVLGKLLETVVDLRK